MGYLSDRGNRGFTLVELLISMAVGIILLGAMVSTFLIQRKSYDVREQLTEMYQNARAALDVMSREIRMAGYQVEGSALINKGSDTITFLGDVDSDVITTIDSNPASASDVSISVNLSDKDDYVSKTDYIYISDGVQSEFIQVNASDPFSTSGEPDTIKLSTGLTGSYPVGSLVQTVEEITYQLDGTVLERNEKELAPNIESLNFGYDSNAITIQITARSSKPDPAYPGDGYRRTTMSTKVMLRNP